MTSEPVHFRSHLRSVEGVTVLLTTHLLDEAERCDRLGILHQWKLVALGTPDALKKRVGGDVVVIRTREAETLRVKIRERFQCDPMLVEGNLRIEMPEGHEFARAVVSTFGSEIETVSFGRPTLEDVFIRKTGHRGGPAVPIIRDDLVSNSWPKFLHPFPLSDKYFVAAMWPGPNSPWGIYLVDPVFDNVAMLLVLALEIPVKDLLLGILKTLA